MNDQRPIGVFDSGVGGISTLKFLKGKLPNENFIFFGDSANAPYGSKSEQEVYEYSKIIINFFLSKNVKAIVIACNTATSAAKNKLIRDFPKILIIGIEPALKLAIDRGGKNILVLGTELTVKLPKFKKMLNEYKQICNIYPIACPGLADYVESGMQKPDKLYKLLDELIEPIEIDSIVLGCTHYPFIEKDILLHFDNNPKIFTGYNGITNYLIKLLKEKKILNNSEKNGYINWYSSDENNLPFFIKLYNDY